ncbi:MAG TPA: acetamidase/formamidase family protein [Firmicutes bacterium]|nr:acetamidase/formamidase family protein [Bacillota bacterium]
MKVIKDDQVVYALSPDNRPVLEVEPGEQVVFETKDCFSNQIRTENDLFASVGWATINPATGPLAVKGARPGDVLAVDVVDIEVAEQGVMVAVPGLGALGHLIQDSETKIVPIRQGQAVFDDKVRLPVVPMIGVIGTAPEKEAVPCGTPGPHGGNMDTRHMGKGARLYLPVFVPGANLCLGDLHAVMGDGEVVVCGVEIPGRVTVRVDLFNGRQLSSPMLETADAIYTIASAADLDEAAQMALENMLDFVRSRTGLSLNDAGMLLSIAAHLEISQVVDPLKTARMRLPKTVAAAYGIRF